MTETELREEIVRAGVMAAGLEALSPVTVVSKIRNTDGSPQPETGAERTRRIVGTAIRHLIDVGLLEVAAGAEHRIRDEGIPVTPEQQ